MMSVNEDCLKNSDDAGDLELRVLRVLWGVTHALKEGNEASIMGFR
jgi:hypothetical protein